MGPKSGLRKRPKGVDVVHIGRLLAPKKSPGEALSYFPNSFSTLDFSHLGEKAVGYARHRNLPKRGVECVPYRPRWYRR